MLFINVYRINEWKWKHQCLNFHIWLDKKKTRKAENQSNCKDLSALPVSSVFLLCSGDSQFGTAYIYLFSILTGQQLRDATNRFLYILIISTSWCERGWLQICSPSGLISFYPQILAAVEQPHTSHENATRSVSSVLDFDSHCYQCYYCNSVTTPFTSLLYEPLAPSRIQQNNKVNIPAHILLSE